MVKTKVDLAMKKPHTNEYFYRHLHIYGDSICYVKVTELKTVIPLVTTDHHRLYVTNGNLL